MKITIHRGEELLAKYRLQEGRYVIGSAATVELRLDDPSIAPRHARLRITGGRVEVEDLGSEHGMRLGDQPVTGRQPLPNDTPLHLGDLVLRLHEEEIASLPAEPARDGDRYTVGEIVAQGAMGVIRRAREVVTGREVAMKLIRKEGADPVLVARFVQEARITAHLEHPNVVPVHDVISNADGASFYTMKMVRGVALDEVFHQLRERAPEALRRYPLEALLTIFQKICDAMAFAHSKGIIHRDLKPANLMLGEFGEVLVMDWGLAKVLGGSPALEAGTTAPEEPGRGDVTLAGTVMGTPRYMSPEQASGDIERTDERSDIYALGAILYEMLTLQAPVESGTIHQVLHRVRQGEIVAPQQRLQGEALPHLPSGKVPPSLEAVVLKALALQPEDRYRDVKALQRDVEAYQRGRATGAERAGLGRQLALLIRRNRTVFALSSAAVIIVAGLTVVFVARLATERNRALAGELSARHNEEAARLSEEAAKRSQLQAETNARLAADNAVRAQASEKLAREHEQAARVAQQKAEQALAETVAARRKTTIAEAAKTTAESSAKTAEVKAQQAAQAAMAAQAEAEKARQTKLSKKLAELPGETEAAAEAGLAGTTLVNSVFLLSQEKDPAQQAVHRRRITAALQRLPRLIEMRAGEETAAISSDGTRAIVFDQGKGMIFHPGTGQAFGRPIELVATKWSGFAEFGGNSKLLLTEAQAIRGRRHQFWDTTTGRAHNFLSDTPGGAGARQKYLTFPDRSRLVSVGLTRERFDEKSFTVWDLNTGTAPAVTTTSSIPGIVWNLVPLGVNNQLLLQALPATPTPRGGSVHRLEVGGASIRISQEIRDSPLRRAVSISPSGRRMVQLVSGDLSVADTSPPTNSGEYPNPPPKTYDLLVSKGAGSPGAPLKSLTGEPQQLVDAATGAVLGENLAGGLSVFSPDSQWLLLGAGEKAVLQHAENNDAGRRFTLALPGAAALLGFTADSSRAVVATTDGQVTFWSTKNGRRLGPAMSLPAAPHTVTADRAGRFVLFAGGAVTLWDTATARRPPVDFARLSPFAVWVSGDGRRAVAIPGTSTPATGTSGAATIEANGPFAVHDLQTGAVLERNLARSNAFPKTGHLWVTENARFVLQWGGNVDARVWDLDKGTNHTIYSVGNPRYRHFVSGRGFVVLDSPENTTLALVAEGRQHTTAVDLLTVLPFDGANGQMLAEEVVKDRLKFGVRKRQETTDAYHRQTLEKAARLLRRELPKDAQRAVFTADEKLVAILSTSAQDEATARPVFSSFLSQSEFLGWTEKQINDDIRPSGFKPPGGRTWRLQVFDVGSGALLLADVDLPTLAAFRWEGSRGVALSSDGTWTEIDCSPDSRTLADLQDIAEVLTSRVVDPATGTIAPTATTPAGLVGKLQNLRKKYPSGWQHLRN